MESRKVKMTVTDRFGNLKDIFLIPVNYKKDPTPYIEIKYNDKDDPRNRSTRRADDRWNRLSPQRQKKQHQQYIHDQIVAYRRRNRLIREYSQKIARIESDYEYVYNKEIPEKKKQEFKGLNIELRKVERLIVNM